jgi:hypothetical protein
VVLLVGNCVCGALICRSWVRAYNSRRNAWPMGRGHVKQILADSRASQWLDCMQAAAQFRRQLLSSGLMPELVSSWVLMMRFSCCECRQDDVHSILIMCGSPLDM